MHLVRHLNHRPECDPLQRYRMATPERVKVDAVAVIRANHGQAGEPAFRCFGLVHNREVPLGIKIQQTRHGYILILSSGWRIQFTSDRFSRMMSALRSISAWSRIFLP